MGAGQAHVGGGQSHRVIARDSRFGQINASRNALPRRRCEPYIAMAAVVGAGLWGVEKKLKLTDLPLQGDAARAAKIPRLPRTLAEATANLKKSKPARELFGEVFVDHFVRTREWEGDSISMR